MIRGFGWPRGSRSWRIVLLTQLGQASSLAYYLDQKYVSYDSRKPKYSGIIGTIVGDDTVLLIIKSAFEMDFTLRKLHEEFPYL